MDDLGKIVPVNVPRCPNCRADTYEFFRTSSSSPYAMALCSLCGHELVTWEETKRRHLSGEPGLVEGQHGRVEEQRLPAPPSSGLRRTGE